MINSNLTSSNYNLEEEFIKYKEKGQTLIDCEKLNIYYYDSSLDCLVLKGGEKDNEVRYPKDKDLVGLCFTTSKKIKHDSNNNLSHIPIPTTSLQKYGIKISNLLIYPLKDKYNNIHGVIEVINKVKSNKSINDKSNFDKNDEYILNLLSRNIGNFCGYYKRMTKAKNFISYYNEITNLWKKIFIKDEQEEGSIYYFIEEFSKLMKNIFKSNQTQYFLFLNNNLFNLQKNKIVNKEGLINKCLQDKKIIYCVNPNKNTYYNTNIDLNVNLNNNLNENIRQEELITFPVFNSRDKIIMIVQIKTNKKLNEEINGIGNEKLIEDNNNLIENISILMQKYLNSRKKLIKNYEYLTSSS